MLYIPNAVVSCVTLYASYFVSYNSYHIQATLSAQNQELGEISTAAVLYSTHSF